MHYARYRSLGLFVGSGVVEAGCKSVIGQRLKLSGMRWTEHGATGILTLRCQEASNRWDQIWQPAQPDPRRLNQHLSKHHTQTAQVSESYPPVTYIRVPHTGSRRVMAIVGAAAYPAGMDEEGFAPSDAEMRRVLELARAGIARYGFGEELHPEDLARPWGNARWQDNAWLRGVRDLLEWVLGERACGPLRGTPAARPTPYDVYADLSDIDEIMRQGSRCPVRPGLAAAAVRRGDGRHGALARR